MQSIKKFVINLKRRPDRLEIFQKACPFTDVEVVYGFDGKYAREEEEQDITYKIKLKPGEIGVFISHLRIFKKILELQLSHALIFEDDAIFCHNFFKRIQQDIPTDTSILYIGGRFEPEFNMISCSKLSDTIVKHSTDIWIGNDMDRTLHAYIISKDMAQLCINEFYRSVIINEAIDSWILRVCRKYSLPIYNMFPLLCHSPLKGDSDIR